MCEVLCEMRCLVGQGKEARQGKRKEAPVDPPRPTGQVVTRWGRQGNGDGELGPYGGPTLGWGLEVSELSLRGTADGLGIRRRLRGGSCWKAVGPTSETS